MQQVLTYKYGVLIKLGWQRLAHVELSSTANEINSGTFTAKESLLVQLHGVASGSISGSDLQFNGDTGSNYARRYSANSDSDGTGTSESTLGGIGTASGDSFVTWHITNIADKEKLVIGEGMSNTTGNNAPDRREIVGKWANTSAQITSIKVKENGSGGWASGTTLTVWGDASETVTDEKTTISDIPANTRYEETDTRKIYRWAGIGTKATADATNMEDSGSWSGDGSLEVDNGVIEVRLGGSNAGRAKRDYGTSNIDASKWVMRFKWTQNGNQVRTDHDMRCIIGLSSSDGSFGGNSPTYGTTSQDCVGMYMDVGHVHLVGMNGASVPDTQDSTVALMDYSEAVFTKYCEIIRDSDSFTLNIFDNSTFLGTKVSSTKTITGITGLQYIGAQAGWWGGAGGINADISEIEFYNGITVVQSDEQWKERGSA